MASGSGSSNDLDFGGPAVYHIVVQGQLSQAWCDRMAGMKITAVSQGSTTLRTELHGQVRDQAELSGVLETLHDLHLSIIKVRRVDEKSREPRNHPDQSINQ
jgi:hypothetical protein